MPRACTDGLLSPQKIGLFEFFNVGAVICVVAVFYMVFASWYLLPREVRPSSDEGDNIPMEEHRQYLATFTLRKDSVYVGHAVKDSGITTAKDVEWVGLVSGGKSLPFDLEHKLQAGDECVPPHAHSPSHHPPVQALHFSDSSSPHPPPLVLHTLPRDMFRVVP